ncbi:hypothetical protein EV421DRAFT_1746169 [Armillaria borealis]|uniref:Uncharacterized protein n=1 Tax=Armillaria borealis TaxID=47425 RepID=A0AA39M5Z2_9AGAR|nr:hypothetical protein EV421DRAFT_1746169 [Armillaria borealis]
MAAVEERYDEVVIKHEGWKATKAKEAQAEKLRLKEEAHAAKLEALRQQELEKEQEKALEEAATKKALEKATAKKTLEDLAKEKVKELEDEDNENLLVAAGIVASGEEGDSKLDSVDLKSMAMAELRRRCKIVEGKKKAGAIGTQKHKFRSASMVESGEEGNVLAGPSVPKRLKMEPEPTAQDKVFTGSGCCGKCCTDKAVCFIHGGVRTCQWCYAKKARCTFNKGGEDSSATESTSVLEILQDISARLVHLENKVEAIADQVEDLVDDYDVNNEVKYPKDFIPKSVKAEFEASRMELQKMGDIYCEILREVAKQRLDRDMALIKAEGLQVLSSEMPLRVEDPYEILNKSFWIGTVSAAGLHEKMLACNKFLQACQDFYNVCGCRVEWQLWKRLLKDQEDMVPGAESVGILELDVMIKMPMPAEDPEEEAEKERHRQATARMRAKKREQGEEVESEVEMYEDLELVLVQEVEKGKEDVEMYEWLGP